MLAAENKIKERLVATKQCELQKIAEKVKKYETKVTSQHSGCVLQTALHHQTSLHHQMALHHRRLSDDISTMSLTKNGFICGDIFIIHDLVEKAFNCRLISKDENVTVKEIFASKLQDVIGFVKTMKANPQLVLLHTGTNDLPSQPDEQIVDRIVEIYDLLRMRRVKLVWSNFVPRGDDIDLNTKGYVINKKVEKELGEKPGAYIAQNNDFYLRDMLHPSVLEALADNDEEKVVREAPVNLD